MQLKAVVALSLLSAALAQPFVQRHRHHEHEHALHARQDVVYVTITESVNANVAGAAATPAPPAVAATPAAANAPAAPTTSAESDDATPAAPASSAEASAPASGSTSGSTSGLSFTQGISYDPYTNSGGCKSAGEVSSDFAQFGAYDVVRIYSVDCSSVPNVMAALGSGQRVMLGLYNVGSWQSDLSTLVAGVAGNWDKVHSVICFNEAVFNNQISPADLVSTIGQVRSQLQASGFTGPVATTEPQNIIQSNPSLCQASDFTAANIHAYFDSSCTPANAGSFVAGQITTLQSVCGNKPVIVTESGWPHGGNANGAAVVSPADQQTAMQSLAQGVTSNIILFEAFDSLWKSPGADGVEQYFGILSGS